MAEAAESAAARAAGKIPPAGWEPRAEAGAAGSDGRTRDLELLVAVLESLRELIPADLRRRLAEALREVLLTVRALIDWYLERSERRNPGPTEVQDIPIQ